MLADRYRNGQNWKCAFVDYFIFLALDKKAKSMLDSYPELRAMYDENDGNTAVYYIKEGKATISSFSAKPEEIKF